MSDTSACREFDFWLGDWQVRTPEGKIVGSNQITKKLGGHMLHENYMTARGYAGESLNVYDATRKVRHQTWVDSEGNLLLLEGGLCDGKMILEGYAATAETGSAKQRITWSHFDSGVRQLWESQDTNGCWATVFDGRYTRD